MQTAAAYARRRGLPAAAAAAPLRARCGRRALSSWALPVTPARFNSVNVDLAAPGAVAPPTVAAFDAALSALVAQARTEGRNSVWLLLPMALGPLMEPAARAGFKFHHAEGAVATLHLWLGDGPCAVPPFATHQVGVAGVVLDSAAGRLLVVKDRGKSPIWKMPGGLADLGEDFGATAVREVWEETGVRSVFKSVLALRHQHGMTWGRSDLYVLCRLAPANPGAAGMGLRPDPREIADAAWVDAAEYIATCTHPLNRFVARAAVEDAAAEARREAAGGATASAGAPAGAGGGGECALVEEDVFIPVTGKRVKCYRAASAGWSVADALR